jgi:hypothetical protein
MSWFGGVNIVLVLALGVKLLRADAIASTLDYSEVSLSHDWPSESFRIGLKLHSEALWYPHDDEDAHAAKRAKSKPKDSKAPQQVLKCSNGKSSDSAPPDHFAPWHPSWKNSIAICAVMRQENITDVVEWLSYYKYVPKILVGTIVKPASHEAGHSCILSGGLERQKADTQPFKSRRHLITLLT